MPRLHIVLPYESYAMREMSEPLVAGLAGLYKVTTSGIPDLDADINYHIPWHTLIGLERGSSKSKQVMLYTHCNPPDRARLIDACERADLIICMSFQGRRELTDLGADPAKLWVIYNSGKQIPFKRKNIGVICANQPNGRKRLSILTDLAWEMPEYLRNALNFVMVGHGQEETVEQLVAAGLCVSPIPNIGDERMPDIYHALDALLVTGYTEGGPLPLMEAFSSGAPVIAPRIGYAADFLDNGRLYWDVSSLIDKLGDVAGPSIENKNLAALFSPQKYAEEHALAFGRLFGVGAELFAGSGADRYAQLLDIIHTEKVQSIVEVGTWSGERAVQMIQAAAQNHPIEDVFYQGFDLFEQSNGGVVRREFSKYAYPSSVVARRIHATRAQVELVVGDTRETLERAKCAADLYFIDGGHSEKTIRHDWEIIQERAGVNSIIIFDDFYVAGTVESDDSGDVSQPPVGVGCNQIIYELDTRRWNFEILPVTTKVNGFGICMVKVTAKNANIPVF